MFCNFTNYFILIQPCYGLVSTKLKKNSQFKFLLWTLDFQKMEQELIF